MFFDRCCCLAVFALGLLQPFLAVGAPGGWAHFEGRQTHPVGLTPDGRHLLAVNTAGARLSVFDVSDTANASPILVAEIPVGLEPVSLRACTDDEVWVVNEVSDSVSVVSLSRHLVVATIPCADEPADVVFAGGRAFVTCARNRVLRVFDVAQRTEIAVVPLDGVSPRALAVSPDGTRVLAAFHLSGNRTTVLPAAKAAPQPPPTNSSLPPPPSTAEIVGADDPRVGYSVLDHDVAEVSVADFKVLRYFSDAGTCLFDLAWRSGTDELWVANTEARNRVRFEPNLKGHVADNRLTRLKVGDGTATPFDLNPEVDYGVLPDPEAQASALAQPTAVVFSADGSVGWVAAFGADRVARFDPLDGEIQARVEVRIPPVDGSPNDSRHMRGPRGLALHEAAGRLYVLNKLANTISVIATALASVVAEVPVGSVDPVPSEVREGRGFLFDARLSGNGTASCATCHPDADRDGLAWDLGDPSGEMLTVIGANLASHDRTPRPRVLHPMKGPMTTQTLRGLVPGQSLHWRGDRANLNHFNATFRDLLGGSLIPADDISRLQSYLNSLRHHPNPNRNPDDSLPTKLDGGDPARGRSLFLTHNNHCAVCHVLPRGTDQNLDDPRNFGGLQPMKTPSLQTVYQRALLDSRPGAVTTSGFGLGHDGIGGRQSLPTIHFYELDELTGPDFADVTAFVRCFDTGTAPAVGLESTVTAETSNSPEVAAHLALLEAQSARTNGCDLVVRGWVGEEGRTYQFDPVTQRYQGDRSDLPSLSRGELLAGLGSEDALTFLGVLPGDGPRLGRDRNQNGVFDGDELPPVLSAEGLSGAVRLRWSGTGSQWLLERAFRADGEWEPALGPRISETASQFVERDTSPGPAEFFRLRRVW